MTTNPNRPIQSFARSRASVRRSARGLALIEILIVIALIGLLLEAVAIGFGPGSQAEIVRATNQLATTINYAYDRARVYNSFLRLEIDFENRRFSLQEADERMYLPATNRDGELVEYDENAAKAREERDSEAADRFNSSLASKILPTDDEPEPEAVPAAEGDAAAGEGEAVEYVEDPNFDPYAPQMRQVPRRREPLFSSFAAENTLSGIGAPIEFPEEVRIMSVRTDADPVEITEGVAYLYFFPMGRTQKAHISLGDEDTDTAYTIKVQPLTGKVTIVAEIEPLKLPDAADGGVDDLGRTIERRSF